MEHPERRKESVELSPEERKIIELVRELPYGELVVSVKNGTPIRAEMKRSILLNEPEAQK